MVFVKESTKEAWNNFWQKAGEFFMTPDDIGINYLTRVLLAVGLIVVAWLILRIISLIYKKAFHIKKPMNIDVSARFFILQILKIFYWLAIAFLVITLLKIDVTGAAGIASAVTVALGLALQDVIACFAAGVIILNQKNIATGDFISVQNDYGLAEGTVVRIHFFFTYLKTPNGQEVTIPNSNMLHAVVTNYTRLNKRRVNYDVGVAYDTDIELAKKVLLDLVKDDELIIKKEKYTHAKPFTKESLLYREIFEKYYKGQSDMVKDFWMPNKNWEGCNVSDPSARVLSNYGDSGV